MGDDNAGPIPQEVIQTLIPKARCFLNHFIITGINGTRSKECPIPRMNPYVIYRVVRFFEYPVKINPKIKKKLPIIIIFFSPYLSPREPAKGADKAVVTLLIAYAIVISPWLQLKLSDNGVINTPKVIRIDEAKIWMTEEIIIMIQA